MRPPISQSDQGTTHGGLLSCDEVSKRLGGDQRKNEEEERLKKERAGAWAIKRAAKEARGTMQGRGRGGGRGGEEVCVSYAHISVVVPVDK